MRQMGIAGAARRERLKRSGLFAASAAFHLVLFLLVFSRQAGALISAGDAGGGPQGPAFAVSLVRLNAPPGPAQPDASAELRPLLLKIRTRSASEGIAMPVGEPANRLGALADRLTSRDTPTTTPEHRFPAERLQPQGAYVPDDSRLSEARSRNAKTDTGAPGEARGAVSTGALWGAIEPCWRNLGFSGQTPVTIEVTLDGRGALSGPPKVVRASAALLNEARLRSEANALAALAACMPRGDMRLASASYRLEFPATP